MHQEAALGGLAVVHRIRGPAEVAPEWLLQQARQRLHDNAMKAIPPPHQFMVEMQLRAFLVRVCRELYPTLTRQQLEANYEQLARQATIPEGAEKEWERSSND